MNDANPPNIDQRLDRLTERHEALTQTVELIAAAQMKNDERMGLLTERMEQLTETMGRLTERTSQVMDTMNRLGNIIIAHEQRIEHLEGQ
jgi:chromosome segregation ATPase